MSEIPATTAARGSLPPPAPPSAATRLADPAAAVLERCRALVEDLSLGAVRRWKDEHPGALAVGYLPIYVPRPLLEAMGCLPVALFGGGDQMEIIRGDSYFQSYICHLPRSVVELALRGDLDVLDALLFPSICDVVRNLGGIFNLLRPGTPTFYVDLPQNFDSEVGGRFYESRDAGASPSCSGRAAHGRSRTTPSAPRSRPRTGGARRSTSSTRCAAPSPGGRRPRRSTSPSGPAPCCLPRSTRRSSPRSLRRSERARPAPTTTSGWWSPARSASSRRSPSSRRSRRQAATSSTTTSSSA